MGVLIVWGICAILSAIIAFRSGRNWLVALVLGLTLGPVGLVIVLVGETTGAKRARHRRRLERFHTDGEPSPHRFAMSRQAKLLTGLVALLIIMVSTKFVNDWPQLEAQLEAERRQREASPPAASPIDEFDRRFEECMAQSHGRGRCFNYEEWQEAIRRSRGR